MSSSSTLWARERVPPVAEIEISHVERVGRTDNDDLVTVAFQAPGADMVAAFVSEDGSEHSPWLIHESVGARIGVLGSPTDGWQITVPVGKSKIRYITLVPYAVHAVGTGFECKQGDKFRLSVPPRVEEPAA